MKWNMGWMHDTLAYFAQDPVYRRFHHDKLTFSIWYAFAENFLLPLSHDEVVYGKRSLLGRMPGDTWQQFANLRALYGYLWAHPGKKLLFMGGELGQRNEWSHDAELDWRTASEPQNEGLQRWVADLNAVYRRERALHEVDFEAAGFEWIDHRDAEASVIAFLRRPRHGGPPILVVCNLTPVPRENYLIGAPHGGLWREILNSDAPIYGGSGMGNLGAVESAPVRAHGRYHALTLRLPPLAVLFLRAEADA
jgi:1,4-alpha-glucan branching enzyme